MATNIDYSCFSVVPEDVLPNIFTKLSSELHIVALVCKTWKEIVDNDEFREMIRPSRVMGIKQLKMHNPNIVFEGKEPLLPRKFYGEYAIKGGLCFFNPGKVKLKIADSEYKTVVLNGMEAIASLFPKAEFIGRIGLPALDEDPHWVWEEADARGFGETYEEQLKMAEEEDKAIYPERYKAIEETSGAPKSSSWVLGILKVIANLFKHNLSKQQISKPKQIVIMSRATDHILGKFMAQAILGELQVTREPCVGELGDVRVQTGFKLRANDRSVVVGFQHSNLSIVLIPQAGYYRTGFVCARRSFGT